MDLQEWMARLGTGLGVGDVELDEASVRRLLDLTREVAHGVERIGGPLSTFLVGVAVGRGAELTGTVETAAALLDAPTPPPAD